MQLVDYNLRRYACEKPVTCLRCEGCHLQARSPNVLTTLAPYCHVSCSCSCSCPALHNMLAPYCQTCRLRWHRTAILSTHPTTCAGTILPYTTVSWCMPIAL